MTARAAPDSLSFSHAFGNPGVMMFRGRFEGRSAVITGGASGLGLAVARRIVAEGGRVVLWDANADLLSAAVEEVAGAQGVAVDVSDYAAVARAARQSADVLGRLDILVNSAGITGATALVEDYPLESWRRVVIVNIASVAGKEGNPNASAYSATKAGVIGFTKSLGKELATRGVIANALAPATFESPILKQLPESQVDYMRSKIPMGRLGDVEESVAMACFMASEECSFTTGSTFDTSGGRTTY
jgi:NAD(P)-dependent dehydrogenase (short-subunit alcohol dehydrogenase family)